MSESKTKSTTTAAVAATPAGPAGYQVAAGTQVQHNGVIFGAGESLPGDVPIERTRFWLGAGWIEAAQPA